MARQQNGEITDLVTIGVDIGRDVVVSDIVRTFLFMSQDNHSPDTDLTVTSPPA